VSKILAVEIINNQYTSDTSEPDPEDRWDRASTETSHNVTGFRLNEKHQDILLSYTPEKERDYYLVCVVYSTGDSFGHDSGWGIEYIDLYKTREEAEKVARVIETESELGFSFKEGGNIVKIKNHKGQEYGLYTGAWKGYFESLDGVSVIPVQLQQ